MPIPVTNEQMDKQNKTQNKLHNQLTNYGTESWLYI